MVTEPAPEKTSRKLAAPEDEKEPATVETGQPLEPAVDVPRAQGWKRYLKLGASCALPVLALLVLAGGGGALLGAAGAVLPLLAALACPLAMYFMVRGMMKTQQKGRLDGKEEEK